jgi:hypothetical protein
MQEQSGLHISEMGINVRLDRRPPEPQVQKIGRNMYGASIRMQELLAEFVGPI